MLYTPLGRSGLEVSRVCLGSMTWGVQNNQADADEQIDYALEQGVNFIDTAEMYAVPPTAQTYGKTEEIIGNWLVRNKDKRRQLVIASKIAGNGLPWIRQGCDITKEAVVASVDASLKRLQTDVIDLYQLHWPNRSIGHFGKHRPGMVHFSEADTEQNIAGMLDILEGLNDCIKAGKIKYCGLSNDSPWGISQYLRLSEQHNLPRMVSIQNEFSLLQTKDWPYLIEQCLHEDIAYLPWSPLGGGMLSGKYLNGARPDGSRWTLIQRHGLFRDTPHAEKAIQCYVNIANEHKLTAAQLALAWCNQVEGVSATIIGATSMAQLQDNIAAFSIELSPQALSEIDAILKQYPQPF